MLRFSLHANVLNVVVSSGSRYASSRAANTVFVPLGASALARRRMSPMHCSIALPQMRHVRVKGTPEEPKADEPKAETPKSEEEETGEKAQDAKEDAKGAETEPKSRGFRAHIDGLRNDMRDFPDIYNIVNLIHFLIFTIFCLCSTGSNVESEWWMRNWGIDAEFAPWAWPLHSVLTNNFLSMTLAMLLMHSMGHSVLPSIGPKGLMIFCGTVATTSGFAMWAGNYTLGWRHEKQFGPWDVVSALFVMQALHQGFMPWQILSAFSGWVKYACWVGAVCICYYDWQPVVCGTTLGLALCKIHPRFRNVKVPTN